MSGDHEGRNISPLQSIHLSETFYYAIHAENISSEKEHDPSEMKHLARNVSKYEITYNSRRFS